LEGIEDGALERMLSRAVEKRFEAGEIILQEGAPGREVLLVMEGQVEVVKDQGDEQVLLARCGAGQVFGEMGFLEARPRFATIRALAPTRILELSEAGMKAVFAEQPELLFRTTQVLSQRLREAQEIMIADLQRKNRELAQAYQELQAAQAEIIIKERMQGELELARKLQESFLPENFPSMAGVSLAARSQPARQVGGDFYDVFALDDGRLGLVIADVSGKGMPAALYMALTRSLVRAEARRNTSPGQVLLNTHRLLLEIRDNPQARAGMFITAFYGILDVKARQLRYARAGHDYPVVYSPSQGRYQTLQAPGSMLGMLKEAFVEEQRIDLLPGDWLVLFTDGVTDTLSPEGEFFGMQNLLDQVQTSHAQTPAEMLEAIFEQVQRFQGAAEAYDDRSLLVARLAPDAEG
jgi:serine phosphatase RsbU (regulator of sigma subunit)